MSLSQSMMGRPPSTAILDAVRAAGILAPFVLLGAWGVSEPRPGLALAVAAAGWPIVAWLVVGGIRAGHPHTRFGAANAVTLLRAGVVIVLATASLQGTGAPLGGWPFVALIGATLALDGVDGALARRQGLASDFGARFDMEVDSAFALTLCLLLWQTHDYGVWILLLGLPRYAFAAAGRLDPDLRQPLTPSVARKAVCVKQIATLCLLFVPGLPTPLGTLFAALAVAALLWSFGRDILRLKRA